jgi:[ribosomal protein S5]-alanine N-acetyltransferase
MALLNLVILMKNNKHHDTSCFEDNSLELIPATLKDYPTIQNMGRFYVYDMTEYMGDEEEWKLPENGLFECIDFKKYWDQPNTFPFILRQNKEIAGFVIIDKKGSDEQVDFNMAQFFILRKFKKKGIGRAVAYHCFNQFFGIWEVMVMPKNEGAYNFWKRVIMTYTNGHFQEYFKEIKHLENAEKKIFRFKSQGHDLNEV